MKMTIEIFFTKAKHFNNGMTPIVLESLHHNSNKIVKH